MSSRDQSDRRGHLDAHRFLDWPQPLAFAHRGGAADGLENTMVAFRRAVDLGYRYLETDVHTTADGVLVAFHDDELMRTCGHRGRIDQLAWRDLTTVKVAGSHAIPRLDELFEECADAAFNIDCKSDAAVDALVAAITRHRALGRVCIAAFSDRRLRRLRRALGPGLLSALGPAEIAAVRTLGTRARRVVAGGAAQVPVRQGPITIVDERFITHCHRLGIAVHVWTIDERAEMIRLLDLGVDGIMTDRLDVLKEVLVQRGVWHEV